LVLATGHLSKQLEHFGTTFNFKQMSLKMSCGVTYQIKSKTSRLQKSAKSKLSVHFFPSKIKISGV